MDGDFFLDDSLAADPSFLIDPDILGDHHHHQQQEPHPFDTGLFGGGPDEGRHGNKKTATALGMDAQELLGGNGSSPRKHPIFDIRSSNGGDDLSGRTLRGSMGGGAANHSFHSNHSLVSGASPNKRRTMALKEQETTINELKKENFSLKLKIFFLEDRMNKLAPESVKDAYKENIELKVETETLRAEVENYRKLLMESHQAIDSLRTGGIDSSGATNISTLKELTDTRKIVTDQAAELERLHLQSNAQERQLLAAKQKFTDLETYINLNNKSAETAVTQQSNTILEDTIIQYRKEIERLEEELGKTKTQLFTSNSALAQRTVELEKIHAENESLRIQAGERPPSANAGPEVQELKFFHNQQLEQGIGMLRDQIADLKTQVIEKETAIQHLTNELSTKTESLMRNLKHEQEARQHDNNKMTALCNELRGQLDTSRMEAQKLSMGMENTQYSHRLAETNLNIEIQNLQRQVQLADESVAKSLQEREKMRQDLNVLQHQLALKTEQAEVLSGQLENKSKILRDLEDRIKSMNDQMHERTKEWSSKLSDMTANMGLKDAELRQLREQLGHQKNKLILVEERWARQTHDMTEHNQKTRDSLQEQIRSFHDQMTITNLQLQKKDAEVEELRSQLTMHSIGMEEAVKIHVQEKERAKQDAKVALGELERARMEMANLENRLQDLNSAYKDGVAVADRLSEELRLKESNLQRLEKQRLEMESTIRSRETELTERNKAVADLKRKVADSDHVLAEGQTVVETMERTYRNQVEERNQLLMKVQTSVDALLKDEQRLGMSLDSSKPDTDFYSFADVMLEKVNLVAKTFARFEHKIRTAETNMTEEFQLLNKKLDRKISQLDKFEDIIRQVAGIQRDLKNAVKMKEKQVQDAKITIATLEHELSVQRHQISTLQSSSAITSSSEKAKTLDSFAKIAELERLLKAKEHRMQEEHENCKTLEESLQREKLHSQNKMHELNDDVRNLKRQVESGRARNEQLEHLVETYKKSLEEAASNVITVSSQRNIQEMRQHFVADSRSDTALSAVNTRLKEEVDSVRKLYERERQRYLEREEEYMRLKGEYRKIKRRLEKRETMIEIALSKLELVNNRRDAAEMNLLHQFSSEVRNMMKVADSTNSMEKLTAGEGGDVSMTLADLSILTASSAAAATATSPTLSPVRPAPPVLNTRVAHGQSEPSPRMRRRPMSPSGRISAVEHSKES